mgnify:CR=1 FL=1
MKKFSRYTRLVWFNTKAILQSEAQYRVGMITWVLNGAITPLLMMGVWLVVQSKTSLALNSSQIVTYYFLSLVVGRVTQVWSIEEVGEQIRDGSFSFKLLKPYNYLTEEMGRTLGLKFYRLMVIIPIVLLLVFLFGNSFKVDWSVKTISYLSLALLLGFAIRLVLENLLALFVFWIEESESLNHLHHLLSDLLSGVLLPIALAPLVIKNLIYFSPFRFYVSFPIEIALKQLNDTQMLMGFLLGVSYLLILVLLYKTVLVEALRKNRSFGQ